LPTVGTVRRVGFEPAAYAGHSLRGGFLTSAEAGASMFKMMKVSRHRSADGMRSTVHRADLFGRTQLWVSRISMHHIDTQNAHCG
jgi:hypothetical protein